MLSRKSDALRRAGLFEAAVRSLPASNRRAAGAIKEAAFWDTLPDDDDEALRRLAAIEHAAPHADGD